MFANRADAGRRLAAQLHPYRARQPVILGMARGGLIVAGEVAHALAARLDVQVARKIYAPGRPEDAIGAVAPGVRYLDEPLIRRLGIGRRYIELTIEEEARAMEGQESLFRRVTPPIPVAGETVILVDDGIATGATALAAARAVRKGGAQHLVLAAPVSAPEAVVRLEAVADAVVVLSVPAPFVAVSRSYREFASVSDEDVVRALASARGSGSAL